MKHRMLKRLDPTLVLHSLGSGGITELHAAVIPANPVKVLSASAHTEPN